MKDILIYIFNSIFLTLYKKYITEFISNLIKENKWDEQEKEIENINS